MSPKRAPDRTAGSVWLREPRHGTRAPALTIGRITEAAVRVLDEAGESGLTMRRLAEELGVHATSLYWHVDTREDLLDLALDAVFGEVALPAGTGRPGTAGDGPGTAAGGSWRDDVATYMTGLRRALLRHPWAAALAGSRPLMGPHALDHAELIHAALVRAGLTGTDLAAAAAAITNYVIGSTATEAAWRHEGQAEARRALAAHIRDAAGRYPTLAAHPPSPHSDWEAHFDAGTRMLIAGLASA